MNKPLRVLIVEDTEDDLILLIRELRRGGFEPIYKQVQTAEEMTEALNEPWDIVLSDYQLPQFTGIDALALLKKTGRDIPFILVSGSLGEETAVFAIKLGANDYVIKSRMTRLVSAIERETRDVKLREEQRQTVENLKLSEEQLRQAQKMEAVGRLAGGVAHDFNNLLTVILGYSEFASMQVKDSAIKKDLEEVIKAAKRAASLTRQLLAFSRQQVLEPLLLNLNEIVSNTEKMLRRLIGEDIELKTLLSPGLHLIKADPGQIEQVLMNLVVNSRDAMPRGGRLSI